MIKLLREIRDLLASIDKHLAEQAPARYVINQPGPGPEARSVADMVRAYRTDHRGS